VTRRLRHLDAPTLEEFLRRTSYRHRVETAWVHGATDEDGGWLCRYWFWWTKPGLNGEQLAGERFLEAPTIAEDVQGTRYLSRAEAEAALYEKIRNLDLDAPVPEGTWRSLGGKLHLIGTFPSTGEFIPPPEHDSEVS
jgi:hypothetical protein